MNRNAWRTPFKNVREQTAQSLKIDKLLRSAHSYNAYKFRQNVFQIAVGVGHCPLRDDRRIFTCA